MDTPSEKTTAPTTGRSFFRSNSPALQLEPLERKLGWFVSGLMLVMTVAAALWTTSLKRVAAVHGHCAPGYTYISKVCVKNVRADQSTRIISATSVAVIALVSLYFVYKKRRPGVIFASLFMFLIMNWATGSVYAGLVFLFFSGWLFLRRSNYRRYGTTSPTPEQRRAARTKVAGSRSRGAAAARSSDTTSTRTPAPSKRYTPPKK